MTSTLTPMPSPVTADTDLNPYGAPLSNEGELHPYRALSRSAVISVILSIIGLLGYLFEPMLVVAGAACVLGLVALQAIKRYPLEYSGRGAALFGMFVGGTVFVSGAALHTYIYFTEVPEGYERISFNQLQPDFVNEPDKPIPDRAFELSGKKVFVKGYTHKYTDKTGNVDHFILVPDLGECCFGDKQTKPTHMIEVKIVNPRYRVSYSLRRLKLAGTFHAEAFPSDHFGAGSVFYYLQADSVQ